MMLHKPAPRKAHNSAIFKASRLEETSSVFLLQADSALPFYMTCKENCGSSSLFMTANTRLLVRLILYLCMHSCALHGEIKQETKSANNE